VHCGFNGIDGALHIETGTLRLELRGDRTSRLGGGNSGSADFLFALIFSASVLESRRAHA
jgi:hypothetical protein